MTTEEAAELLALLNAVTASDPAIIVPHGKNDTWRTILCGSVAFLFRGWTIRVSNDCGDWDYIDSIEAPDGRTWDFDSMLDPVRYWCPQGDEGWSPGVSRDGYGP